MDKFDTENVTKEKVDKTDKFAGTENVTKEKVSRTDKFGDDLAKKLEMLRLKSLDQMTKKN